MTMLIVVGLLLAVAVTKRAGQYAQRAEGDLRIVARNAGFTDVDNVHVQYPFLVERMGLVSRNEEPFPYGYATLDLELAGCRLVGVYASLTPDTRSWLPHPLSMRGVRFQYEYLEPTTSGSAGVFRRVEFEDAAQLLARIRGPGRERQVQSSSLCHLLPADGQQATGGPRPPSPAR